jgi:hypothetical protein
MSRPDNEPPRSEETTGAEFDETADLEVMRERIEYLEVQNQRLRKQNERQQRKPYQGTALALAGVGVLALVGALVLPTVRDLLVALAAVGLFAGALTYFVTPEQFVVAGTVERIYDSLATNVAALADQLGLGGDRIYVPTDGHHRARLFIPQHDTYVVPPPAALEAPLVVTDDERERGISIVPTGGPLFEEFERSLVDPLGSSPERVASQLCDGVTNTLELAATVEVSTDVAAGQASFGVVDPLWGALNRVDHPIPSFLGTGFAVATDSAVEVTVVTDHSDQYDALVRVDWDQPES